MLESFCDLFRDLESFQNLIFVLFSITYFFTFVTCFKWLANMEKNKGTTNIINKRFFFLCWGLLLFFGQIIVVLEILKFCTFLGSPLSIMFEITLLANVVAYFYYYKEKQYV